MGSAGVPLLLLLVGALAGIPGSEGGKETPAHFLYQTKGECRFLNGTQWVRYLYSQFYDRQEYVRFDSDRGEFVAVTELAEADADKWNRDEAEMQYRKTQVNSYCRPNYEVFQGNSVVGRRVKPTVNIVPTKMDPASPNTILLCTARGFYPVKIEIHWLKNGQLEEEGVAFGEELQNGDWTYQLQQFPSSLLQNLWKSCRSLFCCIHGEIEDLPMPPDRYCNLLKGMLEPVHTGLVVAKVGQAD